jgi:hypothetical protein
VVEATSGEWRRGPDIIGRLPRVVDQGQTIVRVISLGG